MIINNSTFAIDGARVYKEVMGWVEPECLWCGSQCLWKKVIGGASVYGNHVILVSPQSQLDLNLDLGLLRV